VPYRLENVDFDYGANRTPEYLRLNPQGRVPALIVDGTPYFESAALLMLLAERHPEAKLAPPPGSPMRPAWFQWIVFFANNMASAYRAWFYPGDLGATEHSGTVRDALREQIERAWSIVNAHLQANGPYMLGAEFSGVDLLATMYMRWSRNMPRTALEWAALRELADRVRARPSWARLYEIEGLEEWRE
jgi:glutathione S-transferase